MGTYFTAAKLVVEVTNWISSLMLKKFLVSLYLYNLVEAPYNWSGTLCYKLIQRFRVTGLFAGQCTQLLDQLC